MELAVLGAVAFIDEDEDFADRLTWLTFEVFDKLLEVFGVAFAKFVNEGAEQAGSGLAQLGHEVSAAAGAVDGFTDVGEDALDLAVEFVPIGDDYDAGMGIVFEYPLGQEHHGDAFAAALGVPDDAAFTVLDVGLGGFDAEVLVDAGELFDAAVEEDEVV
jgi:hypothetical protein